jgi:hypothetical protein
MLTPRPGRTAAEGGSPGVKEPTRTGLGSCIGTSAERRRAMPSSISGTRFVVVAACTACALLAALARTSDGAAAQAPNYLGCITPKATIERATSRLRRTWISVYTKPSTTSTTMSYTIASPLPLWITAESGAFYQVASGNSMDDWPFKPQATLGWVRKSDTQPQEIRNCT